MAQSISEDQKPILDSKEGIQSVECGVTLIWPPSASRGSKGHCLYGKPSDSLYDVVEPKKHVLEKSWVIKPDKENTSCNGSINWCTPMEMIKGQTFHLKAPTKKSAKFFDPLRKDLKGVPSSNLRFLTVLWDDLGNRPRQIMNTSNNDYGDVILVTARLSETLFSAFYRDGRFDREKLRSCKFYAEKGAEIGCDVKVSNCFQKNLTIKYMYSKHRPFIDEHQLRELLGGESLTDVCDEGMSMDQQTAVGEGKGEGDGLQIKQEPEDEMESLRKEISVKRANLMFKWLERFALEKFTEENPEEKRGNLKKKSWNQFKLKCEQFGRQRQYLPVTLLDHIYKIKNIVGAVFDGRVFKGTCLYIGSGFVLTCWHVLAAVVDENYHSKDAEEINQKLLNTDILNRVKVNFDDIQEYGTVDGWKNIEPKLYAYDPLRYQLEAKVIPGRDYAIIRLENWEKQSPDSFSLFQEQLFGGKAFYGQHVHIVGFPASVMNEQGRLEKIFDFACMIDNAEDYGSVWMTYIKEKIHKTAYKSTMYYGSSGSPVVNRNGQIAYMHHEGVHSEAQDQSIPFQFEMGVGIDTIKDHIKKNFSGAFPFAQVEEMDTN